LAPPADILHVMRMLGHKNIRKRLVYTHLVNFGSHEYVCKAAKTVDDAKVLVEEGFEYVTDIEGMNLFTRVPSQNEACESWQRHG
jgi:hypothetical protein